MDTHQSLKEVLGHLEARNLSAAINGLENFLSVHPNQINSDRLHAVRSDKRRDMELGNDQTIDETDGQRKADHDQNTDDPHVHRFHIRIYLAGIIHSL